MQANQMPANSLTVQLLRALQTRSRLLIAVAVMLPLLNGCAVLVAGGAVGATKVAMDARDVGTQVDDISLRIRIQNELRAHERLAEQRILVVPYDGNVLVFGQASGQARKDEAIRVIRNVDGVNRVYDELRVGEPVSFAQRSLDTLLTSRVKASLLAQRDFDHTNISVYSEANEVFLVGRTTQVAASNAIETARNVNGVERVIDVIDKR